VVTYCWTVVRLAAPRMHRHVAHLAHRSSRILHRLPKFAHHALPSPTLVCRALPLALGAAGLVNVAPAGPPPNLPVAPPAFVQPVQQGQFVPPYQPPGLPTFPSAFACCVVQFPPPSDPGINVPPGINVSLAPPINDPPPTGDPPGDPPIITVTTSVDPVDEPSSGIVILSALAGLLLVHRGRRIRI
jgi:hypothetical protein